MAADNTKPTEKKPDAKPADKAAGLSRETKLGLAVAGSFAALVGGVFGVKGFIKPADRPNADAEKVLATLRSDFEKPKAAEVREPLGITPGRLPEDIQEGKIGVRTDFKKPNDDMGLPDLTSSKGKTVEGSGLPELASTGKPVEVPSFDLGLPPLTPVDKTPDVFKAPPVDPDIKLAGFQDPPKSTTELPPLGGAKEAAKGGIELPPLSLPDSPKSEGAGSLKPIAKQPEGGMPEIKLEAPKLGDEPKAGSLSIKPIKKDEGTGLPDLKGLENDVPIKVDPRGGTGTIQPIKPIGNGNDTIDIKLDTAPKTDNSRGLGNVPVRTMENREPRGIPVEPSTRRAVGGTDFDEDIHQTKQGDNYELIAKKYYEDAGLGRALYEYNAANPTNNGSVRVPPIWVLEQKHAKAIPATNIRTTSMTKDAEAPPRSEGGRDNPFRGLPVYTVQGTDETLKDIARRTLGRAESWQQIKQLNISVSETDPLPPGTKLYMPTGYRD